MKVYLMYPNQDFDPQAPLPFNEADLSNDLELPTLFQVMAKEDEYIRKVISTALLVGLEDVDTILYRQEIMQDCLNNPQVIRDIYQIPIEAAENRRKSWLGIFSRSPSGAMRSAIDLMTMFMALLKRLKSIADENIDKFTSRGFKRFFAMLQEELSEEYFAQVAYHLKQLKFQNGVLISVQLGRANEGTDYTLCLPNERKGTRLTNLFNKRKPVYSFAIGDRDDAGERILAELRDEGVSAAANALSQATEHVEDFLEVLRREIAFYIGAINLKEKLDLLNAPITFPVPLRAEEQKHNFAGLIDVCLALAQKKRVIGNTLNLDDSKLVIITGANQGGKSTFLRSVGLAQLMMQAGMFVGAEKFSASVCTGVFTHYRRKEDISMRSGKLDEELSRMSVIVDHVQPNALVLFNESFSATNEREGSEIARQITSALLEQNIRVFFVTHMYEFSHYYYEQHLEYSTFLRAERKSGGRRTFKLSVGEPLSTSFGEDVYNAIFLNQGNK